MQEVKRIFNDKYQECEIDQRPEYKLGNIDSPIVYSVDCIFERPPRQSGSRCDEFIFFNLNPSSTGIYLVERKDNHSNNVIKVKEQLQGGANFIEDFLKNDPATERQPYDFSPVWVSRGLRRTALRQLKQHKVTLRSSSKRIRHCDIGSPLPKLA